MFLAFRWDAVEKRPARGRVYIRAKRGDALEVERLVKSGSRLHHTASVRA